MIPHLENPTLLGAKTVALNAHRRAAVAELAELAFQNKRV